MEPIKPLLRKIATGQETFFKDGAFVEAYFEAKKDLQILHKEIDWEGFRPALLAKLNFSDQKKGGRPPFDPVYLFKIIILQQLHGLSDDGMEARLYADRVFQHLLGIGSPKDVPDAKTLWHFKERLGDDGARALFDTFNAQLHAKGYQSFQGKSVDASIVSVPVQRNSRTENEQIKRGELPERIAENPHVKAQKDVDARWTKKHGKSFHGYKNHIKADLKTKIIDDYAATAANTHDSQVVEQLAQAEETILGDSAYLGQPVAEKLEKKGALALIIRKRSDPLMAMEAFAAIMKIASRLRARVEHVFGWQKQHFRLRTIGLKRARRQIGLQNLTYNLMRFGKHLAPTLATR